MPDSLEDDFVLHSATQFLNGIKGQAIPKTFKGDPEF
jgi:hypothetical protein